MPQFANNTETAIIALVLWAMALLIGLASFRSILNLVKGKPANSFAPTGLDLSPFGLRLTRAHANTYEFIPFALAVLIFALITDQTQVTDGLAIWLVAFRIGQSSVHLISTSVIAVLIRYIIMFIPQIAIVVWWGFNLFQMQ